MIYHIIKNYDMLAIFPNVEIALRMFLSMMVSNFTGESYFLKVKQLRKIVMGIESDVFTGVELSKILRENQNMREEWWKR